MKKTLFVSFDLVRSGDPGKSLAMASILACLRADPELSQKMTFDHISINSFDHTRNDDVEKLQGRIDGIDLGSYQFIGISAYVWNEFLVNRFIRMLRKRGFRGRIILGGCQISYANLNELEAHYPDAQVFVKGYAELALREFFKNSDLGKKKLFLESPIDFAEIASVYLENEIPVSYEMPMLRLETKRGCPYQCTFCAHRDLSQRRRVSMHPLEKVMKEVNLLAERRVKKVNILDPVFNMGWEYLQVMEEINRTKAETLFTLQSRLENIKGDSGDRFLELCEAGNYHLEFGLQTAVIEESRYISRNNNMKLVSEAFERLKGSTTSYEVSLIYGLPGQTIDSFKRSIEFVRETGCKAIKAYPLMLLRGTELFEQKQEWGFKEELNGEFEIPIVTSSNSFTRKEWEEMREIADALVPHNRI
jgi:radical SAM superfamily enzyme YgiQ (UPF0313 family)